MANFTINFTTTIARNEQQDPVYSVKITTGLNDPTDTSTYDGFLLLIERTTRLTNPVDVFYGIVKAIDFAELGKRNPNVGQRLYRMDNWTLIFYNEATMSAALTLMQNQLDLLVEGVKVHMVQQVNSSITHNTPSF